MPATPGTSPLVLLPSGEWIDPADVSRVVPQPLMKQIMLVMRVGAPTFVEVVGLNPSAARDLAAHIAGQVNDARRGGP